MLRKKKILLAEDEGRLRNGLEFILTNAGYQVTSVEDGEQAYHLIRDAGHYDVLLTDMVMPNINGLELLQKLHQENLLPPVVLGISAYADENTTTQMRSAGCQKILDKPFQVTELLSLLSSSISEKSLLRHAWRSLTAH